MANSLNTRQQAFVDYYLANGNNATQAAMSAGYSNHTAMQQGSRLLTNLHIKQQIEAFTSRMADKAEITRDYLNKRLQITIEQDPVGKPSHADLRGAVETAARLNGLIVDKKEDVTPGRSQAAIDARIRALLNAADAERDPPLCSA